MDQSKSAVITNKKQRGGVVSSKTLLRRLMAEVNKVRKIESDDPKVICTRARTIGYLMSVASQVLEKHELEQRIEKLEAFMKENER
jgi:hypothetical protein